MNCGLFADVHDKILGLRMRRAIWGIHPTCIAGSALLCGIFRASPAPRRASLLDAEPEDAAVQAVMLAVNGDGFSSAFLPSDGEPPFVGRRCRRDQTTPFVAGVFVHGGGNHEPRRRRYGVFTPWKQSPSSNRPKSNQLALEHKLPLLTCQTCKPSGDAAFCHWDDGEAPPLATAAPHNRSFTVFNISPTV